MDEDNVILECDFEFKCPKTWEKLRISDDPEKRFCTSCERDVFFVTSRRELEVYKKLGRCIAANVRNPEFGRGVLMVGGVLPLNTSTISVFGDKENADEVIVALNRLQRKKKKIEKTEKEKNNLKERD